MNTQSATMPVHANVKKWSAVFAMTLCVMAIITSEFLPVSLLTPIARDLGITEGYAGQSIAISGLFAMITSLFLTSIIGQHNRKYVVLGCVTLMCVTGAIVAFAPTAEIFMLGRALVGVCIGIFWGISVSVVMRLVPEEDVPKALALLNGGNALSMMIGAPLGSYLGDIIGWRGTFFCIVPVVIVTFIWLAASLPSLPARRADGDRPGFKNLIAILKQKKVYLGMMAIMALFIGMFSLFTYLRPFFETVTEVNAKTLSLLLLTLGVAGLIGTFVIGSLLQKTLYGVLITYPLFLFVSAVMMVILGPSLGAMYIAAALWGFFATSIPVGWWTWLSTTLPDDAEAGGGLMVALIQLAIMVGAALGGLLFDGFGAQITFTFSACTLILASFLAETCRRFAKHA